MHSCCWFARSVAEVSSADFVVVLVSDFAFDLDLLVPSRDALALAFVEFNGLVRALAVRDVAALGILDVFRQSNDSKTRLMQECSSVHCTRRTIGTRKQSTITCRSLGSFQSG